MIYLDNAATTIKKPDAVYDAVLDAMKHCGNSGRGASDASLDASRKIYEARMCLTEFFGGDDAARLVFTANATEALNIAIHGLFEPGEHVITTQLEHNSVLRPLYMQRERGVGVDIVPCSDAGIKRGIISPSDIEALIRPGAGHRMRRLMRRGKYMRPECVLQNFSAEMMQPDSFLRQMPLRH